MALQIGIDLGTTNSLIAQFIDGETRLSGRFHRLSYPTYGEKMGGEKIVGVK